MAFTVRRFLCAPVSGGAKAGRASVMHRGFATLPLALAERGASGAIAGGASALRPDIATSPRAFVRRSTWVNGAVRKLTVNFRSPRCPRNVSLRRAGIGHAIVELSAQVGAPRGLRYPFATAAGCVTVLVTVGG